jgi:flagellar basal-body rod protein FlgB
MVSSLDALAIRQRVTANNVANADTPNFKASEVRFENVLQQAMGTSGGKLVLARTSSDHLMAGGTTDVRPEVVQLTGTSLRNDGNNVDIEQQMAQLAETTIRFNAVSEALARRFAMQRMIASDGR